MRATGGLDGLRARIRSTPLHTVWRFGVSALGAWRERGTLDGVRTYAIFIGHARSGHSIIGALLDAHPQIAISDELDALRYVDAGFSRRQILYLSLAVARQQARHQRRKAGRGGVVYSYHVPGQWQGRHDDLQAVGDSQAGWSVQRLARDSTLLPRLERRMAALELRFIHVMRNPFDNISTMMIRGDRTFDNAAERYFANCAALIKLRASIGARRLHTLRHEDFIAQPEVRLAEACRFLGVEPTEAYLKAAAGILFRSPSRSRDSIDWTPAMVRRVTEGIAAHDFLAGYTFDG